MRLISRLAAVALATLSGSAAFALNPSVSLTFFGEARLPVDSTFGGTRIGGLSGIEYDATNNVYYAVADARNQNPEQTPARFYTLGIGDLNDGLSNADVNAGTFTAVTEIRPSAGNSFPALTLDPEDIVFDPTAPGNIFISSEGNRPAVGPQVDPFINRFNIATGVQNAVLPIPAKFLLNGVGPDTGIVNNLAFESLTVTPNGTLVTAIENALIQDGPQAGVGISSNARLLTYNLATQTAGAEFVYQVEPVAETPNPTGAFATNGLVDLLALSDTKFLAIERSFSTGAPGTGGTGNIIRIFEIDTTGATNVSGFDDLDFAGAFVPVQKTLVFELDDITAPGFATDNIEGITFGQDFTDGSKSLILVSDDNFADTQFTQFVAFKVAVVPEAGTATLLVPGLLALVGGVSVLRRRK